jgi:uncharacterized RDD family membrane protein YckC
MNTTIAAEPPMLPAPPLVIAGFWRRLSALIIDLLMLGALGMIIGVLFFDPLARMGDAAKLIGFVIALAYFGFCNSRVVGGQTLAKRWLRLRVVDAQGDTLSLSRSMLRYVVLGVPFFANGTTFSPQLMLSSVLGYFLALIVFGGMLSIVYLYIFNRRTRQSLHDLAVDSYVVQAAPESGHAAFLRIWKGHLLVVVVLTLLALGAPAVGRRLVGTPTFAGMLPLYQMLSTQPHVLSVQVVRGRLYVNGNLTRSMQAALRLDAPMIDDSAMAKRIAQILATNDPDIASDDTVQVKLTYGYTMGIASGWKSHGYSFKPDELK